MIHASHGGELVARRRGVVIIASTIHSQACKGRKWTGCDVLPGGLNHLATWLEDNHIGQKLTEKTNKAVAGGTELKV